MFGRNQIARAALLSTMAMTGLAAGLTGCQSVSLASEAPTVFNAYEPSATHPFGQLNPDAPEAAADYVFMVGEWNCDERQRRNGEWVSFPSTTMARFYLNGYGITNFTWTPTTASSMTYYYVEADDQWVITNTTSVPGAPTVWIGGREGDAMVAIGEGTSPDGTPISLRITFDNISDESFHWRFDALPPNGPFLLREKTCQRA